MTPQNRKVQEARFPEIKALTKGVRSEDLVIHVEPLDREALYREVVWNSGTTIYDPKRPGQAGIMSERVYRVSQGAEGHALEPVNVDKKSRSLPEFFLRNIARVQDPCKRTIVWQQVTWFETTEAQRPVESGRCVGTEVRIDIYLPPKTGMERLLVETDASKNVRLSSGIINSILIWGAMGHYLPKGEINDGPALLAAVERLEEIAQTFQFGAYLRGLREVVESTASQTSRGRLGDFEITCQKSPKLVTIRIESGDSALSFCGDMSKDDPKFAINNSDFTLDEADALAKVFVTEWKKLHKPLPQPAMFGILRPSDNAPMA